MSIAELLLLSVPAAAIAFKLGALALAGLWAAQGAFAPRGLLVPARARRS
jgi:hypothetical protein